jgi:hypothetical protein
MKRVWLCLVAVALGIGCDQRPKETQHTTAPAATHSRQVQSPSPTTQPLVAERAPAKAPAPVWIGDAYTLCRSSSTGLVGQTVQVTGNVHWFKTAAGGTFVELDGDADGVWKVSCHFTYPVFAVGCLTVRGTLTRANKQGSISMHRCELVYE